MLDVKTKTEFVKASDEVIRGAGGVGFVDGYLTSAFIVKDRNQVKILNVLATSRKPTKKQIKATRLKGREIAANENSSEVVSEIMELIEEEKRRLSQN